MRPRSLRIRIVAVTLLLLAVASALISGVTTIELRGYLLSQLDEDVRVLSALIVRTGPAGIVANPPPDLGELPRPPDSLVAVVRDGAVVRARMYPRSGGDQAVPDSEYDEFTALEDGPPVTVELGSLGAYRVAARTSSSGELVVTGTSEARVHDIVARLVTTELIVALVVLLGAGVAGAIVVGRSLRPLERVAATAARVSALPLDRGEVSLAERVPDVDPRTEVGQVGSALNRMLDHVRAALEVRHDSEVRLRQSLSGADDEFQDQERQEADDHGAAAAE